MTDNVKKIFARNLTRYIAQSGRTQTELADMLGVAQSTFNNWCTGVRYPRMDKVEQLAQYFNIKKSDLIEEKLTPEKEADADFLADVVVRMRTDAVYGDLVKFLYKFDAAKCAGIHQMLRAFDEQPSDKFK